MTRLREKSGRARALARARAVLGCPFGPPQVEVFEPENNDPKTGHCCWYPRYCGCHCARFTCKLGKGTGGAPGARLLGSIPRNRGPHGFEGKETPRRKEA